MTLLAKRASSRSERIVRSMCDGFLGVARRSGCDGDRDRTDDYAVVLLLAGGYNTRVSREVDARASENPKLKTIAEMRETRCVWRIGQTTLQIMSLVSHTCWSGSQYKKLVGMSSHACSSLAVPGGVIDGRGTSTSARVSDRTVSTQQVRACLPFPRENAPRTLRAVPRARFTGNDPGVAITPISVRRLRFFVESGEWKIPSW